MRLIAFLLPFALFAETPTSWVDPDTGHRVIRLTREENSASLYFNQNWYTPSGKLVYTAPTGVSVLDLKTQTSKLWQRWDFLRFAAVNIGVPGRAFFDVVNALVLTAGIDQPQTAGHNSDDAELNSGIAYYEKGKYPEAIEHFERAVKIAPTQKTPYFYFAMANDPMCCDSHGCHQHLSDKAIWAYKKVLELRRRAFISG